MDTYNYDSCSFFGHSSSVADARRFANCGNPNSSTYSPDEYPGSRCPDLAIDPNKGRGFPDCPCKLKGDPVNPSTGNKFEVDEVYRGVGSFPVDFKLAYNNAYANSPVLAPNQLFFGARRNHSYQMSITLASNSVLTSAYVLRPDGKLYGFDRQGNNWVGDPDVSDRLAATYDTTGAVTSWVYTTADGQQEQYNAAGRLASIQRRDGQAQVLTYDANGRLSSIADPQGRSLLFFYDANGRAQRLQDPSGGSYQFAYDASGNLTDITFPDTHVKHFIYGENDGTTNLAGPYDQTGVVDEANTRIGTTRYARSGAVTATLGPNGVDTTSFSYAINAAASGDTYTVTDALGAAETTSVIYMYGISKPVAVSKTCAGCQTQTTSYAYDANGRLSSTTDANGRVTATTFDANGLLTHAVEAQGTTEQRTSDTVWDTSLRLPLQRDTKDAQGVVMARTGWVYNANGQPLARCDIDPALAGSYACAATGTVPTGVRRWTYTYCAAIDSTQCPLVGLLLSTTGPRTDLASTTSYSYYLSSDESGCGITGGACHRAGDLYQVTDALGHVTTLVAYDKSGRVVRQKDSNGVLTDLTYHSRGWLLTRTVRANADGSTSANDAVTQIGYTPYGAVASITDPDGVIVSTTYDAAHRLTRLTDALGNYVQYTLDAAGNKTAEQVYDSGGTLRKSLSRSYNTLGQLTGLTDGLSHTVFNASFTDSYDANGNLVHSADALGIQRKQGYDGLNRLVSTLDNYNGTDSATQNTQSVFAYDARDQLLGVGDPDGLNTTYDYDGLSNPKAVHSPDTGTTAYVVDAAGNRAQQTDAKGNVSTSSYDALNRRLATTYTDPTLNVSYTYDEANSVTGCSSSSPVGRLTRVTENAVTTVFCYDARGNVIQKRQVQSTQTDVTQYSYTLGDRLSSVIAPSTTTTQYTRDGAGRVTTVTVTPPGTAAGTAVSGITYLPFGPIASYTLGNGQTVTRSYDANYALTDVVSPALNLHFARDAMGNPTALGNAPGANPATESYSYDPLYRLTGVNNASGAAIEAYTYSKTGDRLSKTASGLATGTYGYQSGTHWLTSIGSGARSYDANGNTTGSAAGGDTWGYGYNGRNRMTVVQRNGQTVATYSYNALGQRIGKSVTFPQVVSQRFAYDESSQLIGEYGTTNRDYIWLGDLPVAVVDTAGTTSTVSYVHADGLNTPRAITDATGAAIWQWSYQGNPFGEQQPTSSSGYVFNPRFPGQYFDVESGLLNWGFRSYEAAAGRSPQSDPTGLGGGLSTYAYVANTPLNGIDPLGLACNVRGCWNTPQETAFAAAGDYRSYYRAACAGHDPYACRAGEVAANANVPGIRGPLTHITNYKLERSIREHLPPMPCDLSQALVDEAMDGIRQDLAIARVDSLRRATEDNPLMVKKGLISRFHHRVFARHGASEDVFGGDTWDKIHGAAISEFFGDRYEWCDAPACTQ
ncbi:RHS repeat-associated core domain-containing protein [Dyella subtropica]|uniref:RHS repeat-associated core domain-containing protein n=1 Tax=Dyella subtropica TaxID=2992127 RepID=UPI00225805A2|nr:RHS repeat-associated core domain-containing protein [Dyella subtropica]